MTNKLVILSKDAQRYLEILNKAALPDLSIEICSEVNAENQHLQECEILFGSPDLVSQALPHAHQLQWVQSMWAGVTPFMAKGLRQDYLLTGVKSIFGSVMAEYVICHLLMHERKSIARFENQLQKKWDQTPPGTLLGKSIGIMGLGSIGREIAKMAKLFGMKTQGFSRSQRSCEGIDRCF
ncbi:MAG: NAD(P)-dependent oxidoreductase, partial [Psychromonas sp.]